MSNHELNKASELLEKGELAQARMIIKQLLQQDLQNADAWWLLAQIARDDEEKRKAAERVLRLQPAHHEAQILLDTLEDEVIANLGDLLSQAKTVDLFDDDIFNLEAPVKRKPQPAPVVNRNLRPFATVGILFIILIALLGVFANLVKDSSVFDEFSTESEAFETIIEALEIDSNDEAEIEINATGLFTITAEGTGDFDPVLHVYDRDDNPIGYNDDHSDSSDLDTFDARIEFIYIDDYARIEISEFWDESGRALLTVEQVNLPDTSNHVLEIGQAETFDIDVSEWFELNVGERREVTIIAKSEDNNFDPVLEIFDADFQLIEHNDDHNTGYDYLNTFDAVIEDVRLSGTVYVRVSDYSGDDDGDVTISVK